MSYQLLLILIFSGKKLARGCFEHLEKEPGQASASRIPFAETTFTSTVYSWKTTLLLVFQLSPALKLQRF